MSSDSPASVLFDINGNPIGSLLDGYGSYRLKVDAEGSFVLSDGDNPLGTTTNPIITGGVGPNLSAKTLKVNNDGYLLVDVQPTGQRYSILPLSFASSVNLAVDGYLSPQVFSLPHISSQFLMYEMQIIIRSATSSLDMFGSADELINGFLIQIINSDQIFPFSYLWHTEAEMFAQSDTYDISVSGFTDASDLVSARIRFNPPFLIKSNGIDGITATVQDDLTDNIKININCIGYI